MILSVSRRTDIPSYYSEWFFNRIKEGFVCVRNPMNIHKISRIEINPNVVDGIVFWTKNPLPMMDKLDLLEKYPYYFQFTLNAYGTDAETNIPSKNDIIVPAFINLSKSIGKECVVWRYDPIFLNEKYNIDYHKKYFEILADKLSGYTEKCTVSFIDFYKKTARNMKNLGVFRELNIEEKEELMYSFSKTAKNAGLLLDTCSEGIDLSKFDISHASCIDIKRLERIGNFKLNLDKDKNQRLECGCFASIDIGAYNTCKNGCKYCYANFSETKVHNNYACHNVHSPLLFGEIGDDDTVTERVVKSDKESQLKLF